MRVFLSRLRRGIILLPLLLLPVAFAFAFGAVRLPWKNTDVEKADLPSKEALAVELVAGKPNSLLVPEDVRASLGIRKGNVDQIAVAEKPTRTRPLVMPGSTALIRAIDPSASSVCTGRGRRDWQDRRSTQFTGKHSAPRRDLQAGDPVNKGDLLAVLYSVDVGNKKNDLFDALAQLRLDEEVLKRAEAHSAAVPEVFLLNARRSVQTDTNAVIRAENTLRTWEIPEEDIQAVRNEVKNVTVAEEKHAKQKERVKQWARVELKAPDDGFVIEQNIALHETVVDNTTNLFQIAKVDPLIVLAAVPEDELPALQELRSQTRDFIGWTVRTVGTEPITGLVDDIGYLDRPDVIDKAGNESRSHGTHISPVSDFLALGGLAVILGNGCQHDQRINLAIWNKLVVLSTTRRRCSAR